MKEYKYSIWTKIGCILLALVTFTASVGMVAKTVFSAVYCEGMDGSDWTDSTEFQNSFSTDAGNIICHGYSDKLDEDFKNSIKSQKDAVVEDAYKQYLDLKSRYERNRLAEDGYYDEDLDEWIVNTTVEINECISVELEEITAKHISTNTNFEVNFYDVLNNSSVDKEMEYISKRFDEWADNYTHSNQMYSSEFFDYRQKGYRNSLTYYVACDEDIRTNSGTDGHFDENTYKESSQVYFISKHGKIERKGISDSFAENLYEYYIENNEYALNTDVYIFLQIPDVNPTLLSSIRFWNDRYINLYYFNDTAVKTDNSLVQNIGACVVLLAIAFVSGIYVLTLAGKKTDGTNRLSFVDKIPFEIHFIISFILVACATAPFSLGAEYLSNAFSNLFLLLISVFAFACWLIVFEFCYSVARYVHSDRRIRDNFLTYKLCVLIKRFFKSMVNAFAYKPKTVKTKSILLTVLWFAVNLLVMGIAYLCAYDAIPFSILILLADAIANVLIMIKVIKYLVELDAIIDAFSQHQEPVVDIDSLPKSLQLLSESMKYTNTELQNAVAKAVKDERLRSELITNVSHDLKTPLTSIITYVDLLSKCDIDDTKAIEYISVLDDKGAKLKRLIEDLIEASKVTSGNVSVNLTTINLSELCLQSTVDAQPDFEKAGLDLIVKDCEKPPVISADGAKTFRIIENLLSNARKYSAKASRVYVDVYSQNGYGIFEIKNISAQALDISPDELTERFVRGDKSRNQEGNGLGLSIAKELCKLQNGELELIIDGDLFKARVKLPLA
ncbi:MAG: HAMP domain-containing histidine kinase [Eubacterium sp.]|nr:HAMP domain-containing histidine kinase [Eubacterium sp.]